MALTSNPANATTIKQRPETGAIGPCLDLSDMGLRPPSRSFGNPGLAENVFLLAHLIQDGSRWAHLSSGTFGFAMYDHSRSIL
jgi:hypothetical protein